MFTGNYLSVAVVLNNEGTLDLVSVLNMQMRKA